MNFVRTLHAASLSTEMLMPAEKLFRVSAALTVSGYDTN